MEATTAAGIQDQFLTLLTTQLRHQDPLEPTKQEDFIAQLAQFSTLEGIEKLNQNMTTFMEGQTELLSGSSHVFQQMATAAELVDSEVTFQQFDEEKNAFLTKDGVVEAVVLQNDTVHLRIANEEQLIPLEGLQAIGPTPIEQ